MFTKLAGTDSNLLGVARPGENIYRSYYMG